jgi:intergrase/recombinase
MVSYAKKFQHCLKSGDLTPLLSFSAGKKRLVMAAFSALAKYMGVYEDWRKLIRQYQLKWSGKSKDDIVIERLTRVSDPDEVFEWIRQVKEAEPRLSSFMDFMAISGMRFVEAVDSYNLIIALAKEKTLKGYYNAEKETLEHYKFKDKFLRKAKKVFISFVPKDLVETIVNNEPLRKNTIQTWVKRSGLPLRFSDIREAHASYLTKYLKGPEIDFLHGRIGINVFMQNYFNPALISDLKDRTFRAIAEILAKIN